MKYFLPSTSSNVLTTFVEATAESFEILISHFRVPAARRVADDWTVYVWREWKTSVDYHRCCRWMGSASLLVFMILCKSAPSNAKQDIWWFSSHRQFPWIHRIPSVEIGTEHASLKRIVRSSVQDDAMFRRLAEAFENHLLTTQKSNNKILFLSLPLCTFVSVITGRVKQKVLSAGWFIL